MVIHLSVNSKNCLEKPVFFRLLYKLHQKQETAYQIFRKNLNFFEILETMMQKLVNSLTGLNFWD